MVHEIRKTVHDIEDEERSRPLPRITNTMYERRSLGRAINLSDAHCRQPLTASQLDIIERLPEFFEDAQRQSQFDLEEVFLNSFFSLAGEPILPDPSRYMISYSASCAITMVASYCARTSKRVALVEPAFDNIPSILRRENVELVPLPEHDYAAERLPGTIARLNPAVIWLVSPNNPTGRTLSEREFISLVQYCVISGCILVLDASFRFFSPTLANWSQYEILEDSKISYIVLEDTGKTWSTNEIKVGLTVCSPDLFLDMFRLHDDLLQSVSPFHLRVLTEFIEDSRTHGIQHTVLPFVQQNRTTLRSILAGPYFGFATEPDAPVSVEWLHIRGRFDCETFVQAAIRDGVHTLPGTNFFWNQPDRGRMFIRIPLARDPELLLEGAALLRETATRLDSTEDYVHAEESL
ncbi:pyridoxal phosphate-dependent aminotransferase [Nocardia terpenica]|uniref:pyridoxal phosphate-dependent aminotransferase n=1 Tax=Nocardia terpenica TaxID=455432 RepID=UPI0002DA1C86|nr:pyridoxal phosphate-dependent aminotransferase [Nocardia terpenica]NQE88703.1 aminotransferase class I/II-fold pyridoxal phosphate-dependent enzyme [Nocardia terpenica]